MATAQYTSILNGTSSDETTNFSLESNDKPVSSKLNNFSGMSFMPKVSRRFSSIVKNPFKTSSWRPLARATVTYSGFLCDKQCFQWFWNKFSYSSPGIFSLKWLLISISWINVETINLSWPLSIDQPKSPLNSMPSTNSFSVSKRIVVLRPDPKFEEFLLLTHLDKVVRGIPVYLLL